MTRFNDAVLSVRAWLFNEAESPMTPGYIDDILAQTAAIKQRPAWQSPWRWLIMRTTDTIRTVPRIAWPVLLALILAALVFGAAAAPGNHSNESAPVVTPSVPSPSGQLPSPSGPAGNGLIAFTADYNNPGGVATIWVVNPDGSGRRALITSPDALSDVTWSPDGRHLAYWAWSAGEPTGTMTLRVANSDGNDSRALFDNSPTDAPPVVWSPDSTMIAVDDGKPQESISVIDADTGDLILTHPGRSPTWSPDSSQVAFVAESGLQVMDLHGAVQKTLVTNGRAASQIAGPEWSPDGLHIVYGLPDTARKIFVVDVADGTQHDITSYESNGARRVGPHWSPDGSRVLYENLPLNDSSVGDVSISGGTGTSITTLAIQPRGTRWGPRGTRWAPDGMSILSGGWNGSVVTAMVIVDPTGVRQQTSIDVSDLHAGQFSMSWQRVAP